ncbi:unnamed protein product [Symbiodinium natans]|uniref:Uncharacterized protein n=1 Tax=Symbiodinium natans TaxID=878477 RepID=A0A812SFZ3_9DINO|nr:unnamed protein product [Symbiodinium natans]
MAVCSAVEVARGEEEVEAAEMAEADWLRRRGAENRAAKASRGLVGQINTNECKSLPPATTNSSRFARLQMKVSSAGTFDEVEETSLIQADAKEREASTPGAAWNALLDGRPLL